MGSAIAVLSHTADHTKPASRILSSVNRARFTYVTEKQVYFFSSDPAEAVRANLMGIVEQHIVSKQEFARRQRKATSVKNTESHNRGPPQACSTSQGFATQPSDQPTRNQHNFHSLDLAACDQVIELQNPFGGYAALAIKTPSCHFVKS